MKNKGIWKALLYFGVAVLAVTALVALELIAGAKAGIFKEGSHAVIYRGTAGVEQVFKDACAEKQIPLRKADFDTLVCRERSLFGQVFDCGDRKGIELPLLGEHQMFNASVVLSITEALKERGWNITEEHIRQGLRDVRWPGRFDIVSREPLFIIDGGHNPQCIEALVKNIRDYLTGRRVIALTGVLADKDYGDMYKPVMPLVDSFVCITPPNPRKLEAAELAAHLRGAGKATTTRPSAGSAAHTRNRCRSRTRPCRRAGRCGPP